MAVRTPTFVWQDVLNIVGRKTSRSIQDDMATPIVNMTLNLVWARWDWRQSLATLPTFYLTPNTQDYGAPAVVIPSDFYGLRWCNLVRTDNIPPYRQPLIIIKDLQTTHIRYFPHSIGYVADRQAFRVFPRVPDNIGSPIYLIEGQYKKVAPLVTTSTLTTTKLPFDDTYLEMWCEVMKYVLYQTDGDQRAGTVTYGAGGQINMTGQAATAFDFMDWVASMEGLELGDPTIAPNEPLVQIGPYRPSMYGLGFHSNHASSVYILSITQNFIYLGRYGIIKIYEILSIYRPKFMYKMRTTSRRQEQKEMRSLSHES